MFSGGKEVNQFAQILIFLKARFGHNTYMQYPGPYIQ